MTAPLEPQFFRNLTRRANYSQASSTEFYSYAHYRQHYHHEIAEDCAERCVYCDCHENDVGGREAMQIDHFRPCGRKEFSHLENDPRNFHHACGRCNNWKRAKWPSSKPDRSHDGKVGFIDPFEDDRKKYLKVLPDGELHGTHPVGDYLIRLLALNRTFLKRLRLRRILRAELEDYIRLRLPEWELSAQGKGSSTPEQLAVDILSLLQLHKMSSDDFRG